MIFDCGETRITLERDHYCYATPDNGICRNNSGTEVMTIYWNYSCPDGWGSLSDEYITVDDIRKLKKGLKELEFGVISDFNIEFFEFNIEKPLIRMSIKHSENQYHLKLGIYDTVFDEYISVDNTYTESEWQPYSRELTSWAEKFPAHLGSKARTLIHVDEDHFWLGREGTVVKIYPKEKPEDTLQVGIAFTEYGWDSKPYQTVRNYDIDDVRILRPGEEAKPDDLNRRLLSACIAEEPDLILIERLLQQGARPMARIRRSEDSPHEDILYNRVIEHYINDETDDKIFVQISEKFLHYGMDFSEFKESYHPATSHPLWYFAFYTGEGFLRVLKMLLDRKVIDKHDTDILLGHALLDWLTVDGSLEDDFDLNALRDLIRKIMLIASCPHILSEDTHLQEFIWLSENQFDPENFRHWKRFRIEIDTTGCSGKPKAEGSLITIVENETGKAIWKFIFGQSPEKNETGNTPQKQNSLCSRLPPKWGLDDAYL